MPTITEDAIWAIGETARQAAQSKSESVASAAKMAGELAVGVVTKLTAGEMTAEDLQMLTRRATQIAAERFSDLVANVAEDLVDHYF